ncbi:lamin tail domain-containing protein [Croceimicrobium hydrocarbonivorans]|uniref:Lamin tail domain-containing protein n=1 Tax=Croceimicrobium hydrocarbonivorans TaxID=2761580 RepID=A0A7H0VBY4_9FLAO|nr:lamin tail domain-containing protein [Croceimicrobium hydrocarbonivorans]QNR23232.1 lamin tail domain-containing protein [Croceimicrobium hydrocarbonivorans]
MRLIKFAGLGLSTLILGLSSCATDDVDGPAPYTGPAVALSADMPSMIEANGSINLSATLAATTSQDVNVSLLFGGTAFGDGVDYLLSDTEISIPAGSLSASILITAVQDTLQEGNESIEVSIASISGGSAGTTAGITITIEDDDVPLESQIILNEILYDPSNSGLEGDANGDGSYAQNEDEFLEFVNLSSQAADLSGYQIFDTENLTAGTPNHTFPPNTIVPAGGAIVVFGGGTPTGNFGGAIVQTSTSGDLNLNNAGDIMTLKDANGEVVLSFDIEPLSNNPNESYTRNPDLTGDFEQHGANFPVLFSPGTRTDGSPF